MRPYHRLRHLICEKLVPNIFFLLQGFLVLSGSLELASRNIVSGAVRLCYAVMYALFLGFGLAIGGSVYQEIVQKGIIGPTDYQCTISHNSNGPWWQRTPSEYWGQFCNPFSVEKWTLMRYHLLAFLTVPMYSFFLSLRQHAPWNRKELVRDNLVIRFCCTISHFTLFLVLGRSLPY